jgi:hypothetical protein
MLLGAMILKHLQISRADPMDYLQTLAQQFNRNLKI